METKYFFTCKTPSQASKPQTTLAMENTPSSSTLFQACKHQMAMVEKSLFLAKLFIKFARRLDQHGKATLEDEITQIELENKSKTTQVSKH
jgi:hypothetical protein